MYEVVHDLKSNRLNDLSHVNNCFTFQRNEIEKEFGIKDKENT